jgi:hypothetical protein
VAFGIGLFLQTPDLAGEVEATLRPTGWQVLSAPFNEFAPAARSIQEMSAEKGQVLGLPADDLVFEVTNPGEIDTVFEALFGGRGSNIYWIHDLLYPQKRPPWPRFLMPRTGVGPDDSLAYFGNPPLLAYVRFSLARLHGTSLLPGYWLCEPYHHGDRGRLLIDMMLEGAAWRDLRHLMEGIDPSRPGVTLERLAEKGPLVGDGVREGFDAFWLDTITSATDFRDDLLALAVVVAVGQGLARVYRPHWWPVVERISFGHLCAGSGLKADWCRERETDAWLRLCQQLTRVDRWVCDPRQDYWRRETPQTAEEALRQAVASARSLFPPLFSALEWRRAFPAGVASGRPSLSAMKVDDGWTLFYHVPGALPRQARINEERPTARKTRILLPLMRQMARDIERDVAIADCGWVHYAAVEPGTSKKSGKFRRDESDLNQALEQIGLRTETKKGKIRLDVSLAEVRACITVPE